MLKDFLIFLSDQHSGLCTGYAGDPVVRTPNLDRIAASGTVFSSAYTSCPLCVPARMSFLSGLLPCHTHVFNNAGSLAGDQATFLHALGAAGYETVLCGRIHFKGPDQCHGFSKRIFKDITPQYQGSKDEFRAEQKKYLNTANDNGCLDLIGDGNSPTLEYDRCVIRAALEYLSEEHSRPQCILVGTYAPHFPYVAPPELYSYYYNRVTMPPSLSKGIDYSMSIYTDIKYSKEPELVRAARAAYYGMIEFSDQNIGKLFHAWQHYLKRSDREGVFIYLSDHGDQAGARGLYGKKTFFEQSIHIPLVVHGSGVAAGKTIRTPVSIMDLGPTLCDIAGIQAPPEQDGKSLIAQLFQSEMDPDRFVISEFIETLNNKMIPGRAVRYQHFKYITYYGYEESDLLFDLQTDPEELHNAILEHRQEANIMRSMALQDWQPEKLITDERKHAQNLKLITRFNAEHKPVETARWHIPESALVYPEHPVRFRDFDRTFPEYKPSFKEL